MFHCVHFESPAICPSTGEAILPSGGLSVNLPSSKKSSPSKHANTNSPPPPPANSNVVHSPDSPQATSDLDSNASSSSSDNVGELRGAVGGISLNGGLGYEERGRGAVAAAAGQWPPEYEQAAAAAADLQRASPRHSVGSAAVAAAARTEREPTRSERQRRNQVPAGDLDHFFLDDRGGSDRSGGDRMQGMRVNSEAVAGARSRNAAAAGRSGNVERRRSLEKRVSPKRGGDRDGEM